MRKLPRSLVFVVLLFAGFAFGQQNGVLCRDYTTSVTGRLEITTVPGFVTGQFSYYTTGSPASLSLTVEAGNQIPATQTPVTKIAAQTNTTGVNDMGTAKGAFKRWWLNVATLSGGTAPTIVFTACWTAAASISLETAAQSVNVAQVGGTSVAVGSGVTGPGVQRVVIATDVALVTSGAQVAGSDGSSNNEGTVVDAAGNRIGLHVQAYCYNGTTWDRCRTAGVGNNVASTGLPASVSYGQYNTTAPTPSAANYSSLQMDGKGNLQVTTDHGSASIRCTVTVSTATTLTAVGGSCAAPGPSLSIYITDILFSTNAAGIAADSFNTLKYGTGGTCGTGTTVFWGAFTTAATQQNVSQHLTTPIKIPANNEVCWINTTAASKFLVITGYIAP